MQDRWSRSIDREIIGRRGASGRTRRAWLVGVVSLLVAVTFAQVDSRVVIGDLAFGERAEGVLPAATENGFFAHAYSLDVPAGASALTIAVDSDGADLDLAIRFGGAITSFAEVDHLDLGPDGDPSYRLSSPPTGRIHVEVLNLTGRRVPYAVTAHVEGAARAPSNPLASDRPSQESSRRWTGTFIGSGLEVRMSVDQADYVGTLTLRGETYPFRARIVGERLEGTFTSAGQAFTLEATLAQDVLIVESDGATFRTVRQPE